MPDFIKNLPTLGNHVWCATHHEFGMLMIYRKQDPVEEPKENVRTYTCAVRLQPLSGACSEYEQDDIVLEQPRPDSRLLVLYYSVIAYPQAMQGKGVSHFHHYALAATARELNADLFAVSNAWSDAMKATCESLGMKPDQKRSGIQLHSQALLTIAQGKYSARGWNLKATAK